MNSAPKQNKPSMKSPTSSLEPFKFSSEMILITKMRICKIPADSLGSNQALPFPAPKDEPWRRTDIQELETTRFTFPEKENQATPNIPPKKCLAAITSDERRAGQIISNGNARKSAD